MFYEVPYADRVTAEIDAYRRTLYDFTKIRIGLNNRAEAIGGDVAYFLGLHAQSIERSEDATKRKLGKLIREHPMADWLKEARTQGSRVAVILSAIRHPHRFPSQMCSEGCHLIPIFTPGDPCPCGTRPKQDEDPEPCEGIIRPPRDGTGCRALWKMAGLYPTAKNRLPKYRRGEQGSHNNKMKTAILMPQGIAQQFYMQGSRYADVYYREKARLKKRSPELRDGHVETIARVIAAKAWLGDLLVEWKSRTSPTCGYTPTKDGGEDDE